MIAKRNKSISAPYAAGVLAVALAAGMLTGCGGGTPDIKEALKKTASYEQKTISSPASDSLGGEWAVIALSRSGESAEDGYYEKYRANLEKRVKEQEGILSENRYTEYSRAILAARALGIDPTDIGGYDITAPLEAFDSVTAQGLNGAVFALLALNADRSDINGDLEERYLTYIVEQEKPSGGFSLDDSSDTADVDLTAMTLQCLEPYMEEEEISAIIDRGVQFLADAQDAEGGYTAYGDKSSESVSQVIIALSACGIDCSKEERFVKNEKGLYDTLMEFYQKDGSFSHVPDGESDPMATDQAFCALAAYQRFLNGKTSFYDMSDVSTNSGL